MKIKTKGSVLLGLAGMLCIGSLVLNVTDGAEEGKALKMDLQYAVQHINTVKLISDLSNKTATIGTVGNGLVGIQTENFVISKVGEDENQINESSTKSNILGGVKNRIAAGQYSSILGGEQNVVANGSYSTILGGKQNNINASEYSTILGGQGNNLTGDGSVIAGGYGNNIDGDYSVVVGNNNSVNGDNSVALGTESKVTKNNSFLWTDDIHNGTLNESNVFAVVSSNGMVVNAPQAHVLAQLTIGGPLIIDEGNAPQCNGDNSGVMKVVDRGEDGLKCLCGCDGDAWHSLYGQGLCEAKCNNSDRPEDNQLKPKCAQNGGNNNHLVYRCSDGSNYYFNGKCEVGNVVQGTGAYLVTKDNSVHWACQTDDGVVAMCAGKAEQGTTAQCK